MKIEHHCEQSICNGENGTEDRRLDYKNLFAVCWGNEGSNHETICDKRKSEIASNPVSKNRDLPIDLIPTNPNHIAGIAYRSTGLIISSNPRHESEINNVLNLNEKNLKEKRKKNWARIISQCSKKGQINREKLNRLIDNNPDKEFPAMYDYIRRVFSR